MYKISFPYLSTRDHVQNNGAQFNSAFWSIFLLVRFASSGWHKCTNDKKKKIEKIIAFFEVFAPVSLNTHLHKTRFLYSLSKISTKAFLSTRLLLIWVLYLLSKTSSVIWIPIICSARGCYRTQRKAERKNLSGNFYSGQILRG